ncbi:MAG: imidazole glycerol phosphate synthase subunit HisH [Bacteroidota bacterium]|nr:imidazole glycerol phosphate synthase subunit HisH [Bacteroidota bacterium]MDW8138410.1 imidazole glycerol phosphate synthase subunit HisH [Bacteroidota bacterium]
MVTVIDYGIGNLHSVAKAFAAVGARVERTADPDRITRAERLVLPGVGAFGRCIQTLRGLGLEEAIQAAVRAGTPLLGICVGLQLLFERSEEQGDHTGLGLLAGRVVRFPEGFKVPHIGWNAVQPLGFSPLFVGLPEKPFFYFVHSYYAACPERYVAAEAEYGVRFPAVVQWENVVAVQFHPEKSQAVGLRLLANFARWRP